MTASTFYTCDQLTPDLCELEVQEGTVEVKGIPITYWKYSSKKEQTAKMPPLGLPIIIIHGGPSFTHNYMLPLKQQACRGRTVIFYDQAGCGQSRPPSNTTTNSSATLQVDDDYPWLLDPLYYATVELPALIKHLGFHNHAGFHIVANSWGTMLSQLYALHAHGETRSKLASMVLSGPLSDSHTYIQAQWDPIDGSLGSLPPFVQSRIHHIGQHEEYQSDEYQALNEVLTGFFTVRTQPAPDCWQDAEAQANMDIYTAMQGPSEFTMQGVLADFNVTGQLHTIQTPVLLSHGKYDTMRPSIVKTMQQVLPNAERLFLTKSGHVSMIDEPGPMNDGIADFLHRVETTMVVKENTDKRNRSGSSFLYNSLLRQPRQEAIIIGSNHRYEEEEMPTDTLLRTSSFSSFHAASATPSQWVSSMGLHVLLVTMTLLIGFVLGNLHAARRYRAREQYTRIPET